MKEPAGRESDADNGEGTGLAWPRTWRGVYLVVIGTFVLWVALLIALTNRFG